MHKRLHNPSSIFQIIHGEKLGRKKKLHTTSTLYIHNSFQYNHFRSSYQSPGKDLASEFGETLFLSKQYVNNNDNLRSSQIRWRLQAPPPHCASLEPSACETFMEGVSQDAVGEITAPSAWLDGAMPDMVARGVEQYSGEEKQCRGG
jgi:hypothetical protein